MRRRPQIESLEVRAMLATYTVDSIADTIASDGVTTLREALVSAYSNSGADVIQFASSLTASGPATITLAYDGADAGSVPDQLTINSAVTIEGPGANLLTVSGNSQTRVFQVDSGISATIRGLRITGGNADYGAGIYNSGVLTVDRSQIESNSAYVYAGGIYTATGTLALTSSTVSNNTGNYLGGGIYIASSSTPASIFNSTISTNTTQYGGGGIYDASSGAQITNSTITLNAAIYGSGGGVTGATGTKLTNSIVAGNFGATGAQDISGTFSSTSGYNLIGFDSSLTNNINNDAAGTGNHNQVGGESGAPAINASLAALANYGGTTKTHALQSNSPAVDKGSNAGVPAGITTDQRGFARDVDAGVAGPSGGTVDIGAFEYAAPLIVSTSADELDTNYGPGDLSLREAIAMAALIPGNDTITFAPSLTAGGPATITLAYDGADAGTTPDTLVVDSNVTIDGPAANRLSISGGNLTGVFQISTGVTATLRRLRITGGNAMSGGGINSAGNLTVDQSQIDFNSAISSAGGIATSAGTLTVTNSTIANNNGGYTGGGIQIANSVTSALIVNSTISTNSAYYVGGGMYDLSSAGAQIINTTVTANTAAYSGAGIAGGAGTKLQNSIVANNSGSAATDISGTFHVSSANNVLGFDSSLSNSINNNNNGNQVGGESGAPALNAGLAVLGYYGGATKTHALLSTSPAIDKASNALVPAGTNSDQRGFARNVDTGAPGPSGGTVDVGAVEYAAPIIVDTLADELDGDYSAGDLSLREALALAAALQGADTITFASALTSGGPATIALTYDGGDAGTTPDTLSINSEVTIAGPGANLLSISGSNLVTVLTITAPALVRDLRITGGNGGSGGGINNSGALTLERMAIENNVATAGGGIYSVGPLTITSSTIAGNSGSYGGGGIFVGSGSVSVINSTISSNIGSGVNLPGFGTSLSLIQSTVTANTDGLIVSTGGVAVAKNSIIAGNLNGSTPSEIFGGLNIAASTNNLIGTGGSGGLTNGTNGNIVLTAGQSAGLAPLANYGGSTRTHAIQFNSPAVDHGSNANIPAGTTTDQRGNTRNVDLPPAGPSGGTVDIGAYEFAPLVVDTLVDENDGNYGPGDLSLREALALAAATTLSEVITFAPSLVGTIELNSGLSSGSPNGLTPVGDLLIYGPGADRIVVDANGAPALLTFPNSSSSVGGHLVSIHGLKFTGAAGAAITGGGASFVDLTLDEVNLFGNGGGVSYQGGRTFIVSNSKIVQNSGFGISHAYGGTLTFTNSEISNNGSGISYTYAGGAMTLSGSTIAENNGTGLSVAFASANIFNSTISGNQSTGTGGIVAAFASVSLINSTVTNNRGDKTNSGTSSGTGGVNADAAGTVTMHNTIVAGNFAGAAGPNAVQRDLGRTTGTYVGTFVSTSSSNLIGYDSTSTFPTGNNNQLGTPASPLNPKLAPLADYGGGRRTHALLPDSTAIDRGNDSIATANGLLFDERGAGYKRGVNIPGIGTSIVDIGAVEAPWRFATIGGTSAGKGVIQVEDAYAKITEGDSSVSEVSRLVDISGGTLRLSFKDLVFDNYESPDSDAFEFALLDESGQSLVPTLGTGNAFFRITEGIGTEITAGTTYGTGIVTVDVSHLAAGTRAKVVARLVNSDIDTQSMVRVALEAPRYDLWGVGNQPRQKVDVFLLFDDTGSFAGNAPIVGTAFQQIISSLNASFPQFDFAFGVGRFEDYVVNPGGPATDRPFILNQPIISDDTPHFLESIGDALSSGRISSGGGLDYNESVFEALYQTATGVGYDGVNGVNNSGPLGALTTQTNPSPFNSSGDVPAFVPANFVADPTSPRYILPPQGTLGGAGFRQNALPIVILATDNQSKYRDDVSPGSSVAGAGGINVPLTEFTSGGWNVATDLHDNSYPINPPAGDEAGIQQTIAALNNLGALVIGLGADGGEGLPRQFLEAISKATGAVSASATDLANGTSDPIAFGDPLFFQVNPSNLSSGVSSGISAAVSTAAIPGELFRYTGDYTGANAGYQNFGQIHYFDPSAGPGGTWKPIGTGISDMTISPDGSAYFVVNKSLNGISGPLLMKVDLNQVVANSELASPPSILAKADIIGRIALPAGQFNAATDRVTGLAYDPVDDRMYALLRDADATDRLYVINRTSGALVSDLGQITGTVAGQAYAVQYGAALTVDSDGTLLVSDDDNDVAGAVRRVFRLDAATGHIIEVVDGAVAQSHELAGITIDPSSGAIIASNAQGNASTLVNVTPGSAANPNVHDMLLSDNITDVESLAFVTPLRIRGVTLVEQTALTKTHVKNFVVPSTPGALQISFSNLYFDAAGNLNNRDVNDAFEISVLRTDTGRSALATIDPDSDAVFNITQGQSPAWAAGVELLDASGSLITNPGSGITSGFVRIDVSALPVGMQIQIVARLVNNDVDDTSMVKVDLTDSMQGMHSLLGSGVPRLLATPANSTDQILPGVHFGDLHDVSSAFKLTYQQTTFNKADKPENPSEAPGPSQLEARVTLAKVASALQVRGDLLLAIKPPINQATGNFDGTQLANFDGRLSVPVAGLPAGTPFIRLSNLLPAINEFYQVGSLDDIELVFQNPGNDRFDFDFVVLGELNQAPTFVSDPYSGVRGQAYPVDVFPVSGGNPVRLLEIVAQSPTNNNEFRYTAQTRDPNNDRVRIEIVSGPTFSANDLLDTDGDGFTDTIKWKPTTTNVGEVQQFVLRAVDEFGAFDPANDQIVKLRVVADNFNRAPYFTTSPETSFTFDTPYSYDANAFDPDGHALTYSGVGANNGLGARPKTYQVTGSQLLANGTTPQVMNYLTFINEATAAAPTGTFSSIRIYEAGSPADAQVLKFNRQFQNYGTLGTTGSVAAIADRSVVRLTGDAWKAYQLDVPYRVTPDTILEFTFAGDTQGVYHGIGMDSNLTPNQAGDKWLQVYGTGNAGGDQSVHNYSPLWTETPNFAVNPTTGEVTWTNPPTDLIDKWVHVDIKARETSTPQQFEVVQSYELFIAENPANHDPIIVSTPQERFDVIRVTEPQITDGTATETTNPSLGAIHGQVWLDIDGDGIRDQLSDLSSLIELTEPGDVIMDPNDDGSSTSNFDFAGEDEFGTPVPFTFEFFQDSQGQPQNFNEFWINNNGNITFTAPLAQYTPDGLSTPLSAGPIVAPFWADVDTGELGSSIGSVHLARGMSSRGNPFIQVDWKDVGYYNENSDLLNDFTLYIEDNPLGDIVAFVYRNMEWTTGDASGPGGGFDGTGAEIGFSDGLGNNYLRFGTTDGQIAQDGTAPNSDTLLTPFKGTDLDPVVIAFQIDPFGTPLPFTEPGIDGFTVELVDPISDQVVATQITQSLDWNDDGFFNPFTEVGSYQFNNVTPGTYEVRIQPRSAWLATHPSGATSFTFYVVAGETATGDDVDFGQGRLYVYDVDAIDPDGDTPLTYTLVKAPATPAVSFNSSTGEIAWLTPPAAGDYDFEILVEDGKGGKATQSFTLHVADGEANVAPAITSSPITRGRQGGAYSYTVRAFDANYDPLTFELTQSPTGMVIDRETGAITWQPTSTAPANVTVVVRDAGGLEDTQTYTITVAEASSNQAPQFTSDPVTSALPETRYFYQTEVFDPEGDAIASYSLVDAPVGMSIQGFHGYLVWDPRTDQIGTHHVTVQVVDARGGIGQQSFDLEVLAPNDDPEIDPLPFEGALVGQQWSYQVVATDPNGDTPLFYELELLTPLQPGDSVPQISNTGLITWANPPREMDLTLQVTVNDGRGGIDGLTLEVPVRINNKPPTFTFGPATPIILNEAWTYTIGATDDHDLPSTNPASLLRFSIDPGASQRGLNINAQTGQLTWTPTDAAAATVYVTVTDSGGLERQAILSLPVNVRTVPPGQNEPPKFESRPEGSATIGRPWRYSVRVTDIDVSDDLQVTVENFTDDNGNPVAAANYQVINQGRGRIQIVYTPAANTTSMVHFDVVARDRIGGPGGAVQHVVTQSVDLPVEENYPPIIVSAIASSEAAKGTPKAFEFKVIDFDGDPLQLELLSPAPGVGKFTTDQAGSTQITSIASASTDPASPSVFYLQFTPELIGQQSVTVRITDSGGKRDEHTIQLHVVDLNNQPPNVTLEVPGTLFVGSSLDISVQGSNPDADGDRLTYYLLDHLGNRVTEITDRTNGSGLVPAGMQINQQTGRITWTPTAEQVTPASDVPYSFTVQVTDGHHVVTLGPAQIRVKPQAVVDSPPFIVKALGSARIPTGSNFQYQFGFIDFDGPTDQLTLTVLGAGNGSFSPSTINPSSNPNSPTLATYSINPSQVGNRTITIRAMDIAGHIAEHTFNLEIFAPANPNQLPSGSLRSRDLATVDEQFVAQVTGTDPDGQQPVYKLLIGAPGSEQYVDRYQAAHNSFGDGLTPVGMQIDPVTGEITWSPTAAQLSDNAYTYAVAIDDDSDPTNGFTKLGPVDVRVVSTFTNTRPTITSTPEGIRAIGGQPLKYQVIGKDEENDPLIWTLVSGPSTARIDANGLFTWDPGADEAGKTQTAVIQVSDPYGPGAQQGITLTLNTSYTPGNTAPRITSTPTAPGDGGEVYTYLLRATDDEGQPITLKLVPPSPGVSTQFVDFGDGTARFVWNNPVATIPQTFTFEASDGSLTTKQTITLTPGSGPSTGRVDTPPTINNLPPHIVTEGDLYFHKVDATDPDATGAAPLTYSLIAVKLDALGNETTTHVTALESAINPTTGQINWQTIENTDVGAIRVTIRASQGGAAAVQKFTLYVIDRGVMTNLRPELGPAATLTAAPGQLFTFVVPGSDPQGEAIEFFLVKADGTFVRELNGLSITADGRVTWQVPADASVDASRTFTVQVQDAIGQKALAAITHTINIDPDSAPSVGLSVSTLRPEIGATVAFSVIASDDVGVTDRRLTLIPVAGGASINVPVAANGAAQHTFNVPAGTEYNIVATAFDGAGNSTSTDPVLLVVRPLDLGKPIVSITSPGSGSILEAGTPLVGQIDDPDNQLVFYSVTATPVGGGAPIELLKQQAPAGGPYLADIGQSSPATITTLSPFILPTDTYEITIVARDASGKESTDSILIGIESDVTLGNFALSFTDMQVSVGGLPITVRRRYDTLDADKKGDFGHGWSMEVITGKMEFTLAGDNDSDLYNFLGYDAPITGGSRVTFTLPNGEKQGFTVVPVPVDQGAGWGVDAIQGLFGSFAMAFRPDPGQGSSLELMDLPGTATFVLEHFNYPGDYEFFMPERLYLPGFQSVRGEYNDAGEFTSLGSDGTPINFTTLGANFLLHTRDGASYEFDTKTGELLRSVDAFQNKVDFTSKDIVAKDANNQELGRLTILREDPNNSGLITKIKDAKGNSVEYGYDALGNLVSFKDRVAVATGAGPTATYIYGQDSTNGGISDAGVDIPDHVLTTVKNALDVSVIQIGFDSTGKLRKIQDASGPSGSGNFSYPTPTGDGRVIETAADANGITTEIVRDARGNVERSIQLVDDTGASTGWRYLVTMFVYDSQDRQTHVSVPFEAIGENNRLTAGQNFVTNPTQPGFIAAQWQSRSTYDEQGNLRTKTDALGRTTKYDNYDDAGHPRLVTDPNGNETTNVYFDGLLTSTIDAAGGQADYHYNPGGELDIVTQIGENGETFTTSFGYTNGRITSTTGPDNQTRYFVYDQLGNQTLSYSHWTGGATSKTLVTRNYYDANDRVWKSAQYTIPNIQDYTSADDLNSQAPNWTIETYFNAAGQVYRTVDRSGTETLTTYDVRGNVVETRTASKDQAGTAVWIVTRTLYDNNGRAYFTTDPYTVPQAGYSDTATPPAAYGAHTKFDDSGRVTSTSRFSGVVVTFASAGGAIRNSATTFNFGNPPISKSETYFDAKGRVQFTVDSGGLITKFEYYPDGRQQTVTQYLTGTLINLTNPATRQVDPATFNPATDVLTTSTTYDLAGRVDTTTDAKNIVTKFGYDGVGRVTSTIADYSNPPAGHLDVTTTTNYDKLGRKDYEIDALGRRTDYEYDSVGRLKSVILPEVDHPSGTGRVRPRYEYGYDAYGNQILIRDPMHNNFGIGTDNKETNFAYDHLGRQIARTLPIGVNTSGVATDFVERMFYDDRRLSELTTPASSAGLGQLAYSVDFEGRVTEYLYDNSAGGGGRLVAKKVYSALTGGFLVTVATSIADVRSHLPGAATQTITYKYDGLGRLVTTEDSAFGTGGPAQTIQAYDAEGRLTQIASPQGTINYKYDNLGRLTRTYTGSFDSNGTNNPGDGQEVLDTRYSYDRLGRLTELVVVERNDRDVAGTATTWQGSSIDGEVTRYTYDKNGNLDESVNVASVATNSVISDYVYDNLNRLDLLRHYRNTNGSAGYQAADALVAEYDYTVRADGKRTKVVEQMDLNNNWLPEAAEKTTIDWVYDELGRLTEERYDSFNNTHDSITRYAFDLASNRVKLTKDAGNALPTSFTADEVTTYEYDENDRLENESRDVTVGTANDMNTVYSYTGTLQTGKTVRTGSKDVGQGTISETHTSLYNEQGRMRQYQTIIGATTTTYTYKYNSDGIRVIETQQINGGSISTTVYHIDPNNPTGFAQIIEEGVELAGTIDGKLQVAEITKSYTLGHDVIAQGIPNGVNPSTPNYFVYDGHGSVRALLTAAAAFLSNQRFAYDAYGKMLLAGVSGYTATPGSALTSLLYSGERTDRTGLQYLRARYYDPSTGRFNRLDPFAGNLQDPLSLHKYLYTHANPVMGIDPTGQMEMVSLLTTISSIATNFAVVSTGVIGASAAASAGIYSYFFNASPLTGAIVGAQIGASFSWAYALGGGGVKGWENVGETALAGFFAGVNKLIAKAITLKLNGEIQNWTTPQIAQDFFEGFAAGVWADTFGQFLEKRTDIENDIALALASLAFSVTSQVVKTIPDVFEGRMTFRDAAGDVLYNTIPAWIQGTSLDNILAKRGIPQPARGLFKTTLTSSYVAGANAFIEILDFDPRN